MKCEVVLDGGEGGGRAVRKASLTRWSVMSLLRQRFSMSSRLEAPLLRQAIVKRGMMSWWEGRWRYQVVRMQSTEATLGLECSN